MSEEKTLFTAVFERYEYIKDSLDKKVYLRDVRLRDGSSIRKQLILDETHSKKIQGHLSLGEYIAFLADLEFKNIEFQYPHGNLEGV